MAIALSKLILDRDFSLDLLDCFLNTENVLPLNNGENAEPWIQDKKYKRKNITKLQQQALEFCLLYDKIILYDGYAEIEIVNKNLSEFIEIKSYKEKNSFQLDKGSEIQTCFELKPIIFNTFKKNIVNSWDKEFKKRIANDKEMKKFSDKYADGLYDFMAFWRVGKYDEAIQNTHLPLNEIFPASSRKNIVKSIINAENKNFAFDMIASSFELDSNMQLAKFSKDEGLPIASNRANHVQTSNAKKLHETYTTFCIQMRDEFCHFPIVNSPDELLRLRERHEVIRVRELLNYWCDLMFDTNVELAEKIRQDIRKANQELCKLNNVRKINGIFFYLSFITDAIPIISSILGYSSKIVSVYEQQRRDKVSWLLIGR